MSINNYSHKISRVSLLFLIITTLVMVNGCSNSSTAPDYPDGYINGYIYDNVTGMPLGEVTVSTIPPTQTVVTDSTGTFFITVKSASTSTNMDIVCSKIGYSTFRWRIVVPAGDTLKINIPLEPLNNNAVFIKNDLIVSEYQDANSASGLNLYELVTVRDNELYNDAVLRDSAGSRTNFRFLSGEIYPSNIWKTRFSPLLGLYSQYDFDTLSRYDVGNREIDPNIDFPFTSTDVFDVGLNVGATFAYYLKGRYDYFVGSKRVYGLLRVDSVWYDNSSAEYKVMIDLKVNRAEQNNFVPNMFRINTSKFNK
ncbi:MAG: carboxypeptidase-like regulatory domain-containing protein [Ignavibacteria bacterium]